MAVPVNEPFLLIPYRLVASVSEAVSHTSGSSRFKFRSMPQSGASPFVAVPLNEPFLLIPVILVATVMSVCSHTSGSSRFKFRSMPQSGLFFGTMLFVNFASAKPPVTSVFTLKVFCSQTSSSKFKSRATPQEGIDSATATNVEPFIALGTPSVGPVTPKLSQACTSTVPTIFKPHSGVLIGVTSK